MAGQSTSSSNNSDVNNISLGQDRGNNTTTDVFVLDVLTVGGLPKELELTISSEYT